MKKVYVFIMKTFVCMIFFLILGILCKSNVTYQYFIQKKIYQENISFASFEQFYNRYLGGIFPIEVDYIKNSTAEVFGEKLIYQDMEAYLDGVRLKVTSNYLVPSQDDGIVVYIGEKEGYQNVVMVENKEGIDVWYGNLCNSSVKLYDQVKSGEYLGEACGEEIYLVYTKGNQILDYKNYLG